MTFYERHLPHWQPEGASLFVTWRLYGSLPNTSIRESQPATSVFEAGDRELDLATTGPLWLKDERVAQCVADALRYGERQLGLYELQTWVLMANHVHILIYPKANLPRITKSIKNFSARQANAILGRTGCPFWQDESYDHWVRGGDEEVTIVRYIEDDPVVAGLVGRSEDWRCSSAFVR